tara:strand:- start:196 stop:840 length:645 start_codon:yes stop_codon:yes gene_type:complete
MNKTRTVLLLSLAIVTAPVVVKAELYIYTDKEGIIHITNIPKDTPAPPPPKEVTAKKKKKTENTFSWKDELGVLRRVHKVGIAKYDTLIRKAAKYYSLPPSLIKAVIAVESSFEPKAVSPAGAQGLMQLIPSTAQEMQVINSMDPEQNIFGGTRYLRILANQFNGDLRLTIAAYNAGPGAVKRKGGVPNYEETIKYVKRVIKLYHHYLRESELK